MTKKKEVLIKGNDPIRLIKYLFKSYYDSDYFVDYYKENKEKFEKDKIKSKEYMRQYYLLNKEKKKLLSVN